MHVQEVIQTIGYGLITATQQAVDEGDVEALETLESAKTFLNSLTSSTVKHMTSKLGITKNKIELLLADVNVCADIADWFGEGDPASFSRKMNRELARSYSVKDPTCRRHVFERRTFQVVRAFMERYAGAIKSQFGSKVDAPHNTLKAVLKMQSTGMKPRMLKKLMLHAWLNVPELYINSQQWHTCRTVDDVLDLLLSKVPHNKLVQFLYGNHKLECFRGNYAYVAAFAIGEGLLEVSKSSVGLTGYGRERLSRSVRKAEKV